VSGSAGALVVTWLGAGFIATGPIVAFTGVGSFVGIVTGLGIITVNGLITGADAIAGGGLITGADTIAGGELITGGEFIAGIELIIGIGAIAIANVGVVGMPIGGPPKFPGIPDSSARPSSDSTERDAALLDRRAPTRRPFLARSSCNGSLMGFTSLGPRERGTWTICDPE
jgi:hypothetical protein